MTHSWAASALAERAEPTRVLLVRGEAPGVLPLVDHDGRELVVAGSVDEARARTAKRLFSAVVAEVPCRGGDLEALAELTDRAPLILLVSSEELASATELMRRGLAFGVVLREAEGHYKTLLEATLERAIELVEARRCLQEIARRVGSDSDSGPAVLLRAQQLESLRALAEGITHSLNNVFSPILLATELLTARSTSEQDREILESVSQSVSRGTELVRQVLGFARAVDGEPARFEVRHLMRSIQRLVRETSAGDLDVSIHFPEDLWPVVGDAPRVFQTLVGLCLKSRSELPEAGSIRMDAANLHLDDEEGSEAGRAPGDYVCISVVASRGEGADGLERPATDEAESVEEAGVELAAARTVAEQHGGWFVASRWPGQGTLVRIGLPAQPPQVEPPAEITPMEAELANQVVLVADEDEASRVATQQVLQQAGFRVATAVDPDSLFGAIDHHEPPIAAVLLDLGSRPVSNHRLLEELKARHPELPVIATEVRHEHDAAAPVVADVRLRKPLNASRLLVAVARVLA